MTTLKSPSTAARASGGDDLANGLAQPVTMRDGRDDLLVGQPCLDLRAATPTASAGLTFGMRLRAAREERGEDLETCAHFLRLPLRVLRQLESDSYDGSDSPIYLSSYISKYAGYLAVDDTAVQADLRGIQQVAPPLVASGGISRSRFLLDRYATAATYVVLTAVIVVPMIWLGVRGTLDRDLSHLAPLDAMPVAQQDVRAPTDASSAVAKSTLLPAPQITPPVIQDHPLMASMAAFPGFEGAAISVTPGARQAVTVGSGEHSVNLDLSAASWVEIVDHDGTRIEYGLLPAGSNKTYHSDQPLDVRIGNASGAQLSIDGQAIALENFRRANVARLRVQIEDGKASATEL